jgi:DNA-binding FadR family transcriptional regulator
VIVREPAAAIALDFHAVRRGHAADDVFDQLASAIMRGELAAGDALPPERVLADRFGVSRIIARQAVHRLAERGLVRVRQGGATIVQDPTKTGDIRTIELYYRLGPFTPRDVRDNNEKQILNGYSLLRVAALRASRADKQAIAAIVDAYDEAGAREEDMHDFERRLWTKVAEAGGNRILLTEINYWFQLLETFPQARHEVFGPPHARAFVFKEIARRLVEDDDAPGFYLQATAPVLEHLSTVKHETKRRSR